MAFGNPDKGLLKAMIAIFREGDPGDAFRSKWVAGELIRRGHWAGRLPREPERSVNSYCSQNRHIFERVEPDDYVLTATYYWAP